MLIFGRLAVLLFQPDWNFAGNDKLGLWAECHRRGSGCRATNVVMTILADALYQHLLLTAERAQALGDYGGELAAHPQAHDPHRRSDPAP